jgi:hypothetical protein
MDGDKIAVKDGNPVWVNADNSEVAVDHGHTLGKINELTGESVARKNKLRDYEDKLKVLEGIENPAEYLASAKKAMETVQNLDAKKLIDAGEVDKVKAELSKIFEGRLSEAQKLIQEKDAVLTKEMIGGRFARSKYIADALAIPADLVESAFGRHFQIKDGKVIALGHDGREIYSRKSTSGDLADFDEALSILVDGYPNKAAILKGSSASGGGAGNGGGGQAAPGTISRTDSKGFLGNLDKIAAGEVKVV